jgi:multiple sugar transport system permease protein
MLRRVMLPLVLPGVVTIAMFAFFSAWNEFLAALIYLADTEKFTLPLLLATARNNPGLFGGTNWGGLQAGVTVTILPCLFVFIMLQRYISWTARRRRLSPILLHLQQCVHTCAERNYL